MPLAQHSAATLAIRKGLLAGLIDASSVSAQHDRAVREWLPAPGSSGFRS
jgi:hypothetical protein